MKMEIPFSRNSHNLRPMKPELAALILACFVMPCEGQIRRTERKSLLDSDPSVVYLAQTLKRPIVLKVIKEAAVFSDKDGNQKLGTLKADQSVQLEAISEKSYRVRGQGTHNGISGWVAPWAFSSTDPEFIANFKLLYARQIQVQKLIAAKEVAVGMTPDEVNLSQGNPTKTSVRKTAQGQSGKWEFIEYEDVKNYATEIDRTTGQAYRRLVSITRVEKGKVTVEFENDVVTAVEETEDHQGGNLEIIVPPLVFRW